MVNSTVGTSGRLGNHVIRNIAAHFLAKKHNLRFNYSYMSEMQQLGLCLFVGSATYGREVTVDEDNYFAVLEGPPRNIIIERYFQTTEFMFYLRGRIEADELPMVSAVAKMDGVEDDGVFVHVRLGDIADFFELPFAYYDDALTQAFAHCNHGYISSDSIEHPTCTALIKKYGLQPIRGNEVDAIQLASRCRHVVTSQGSFSWLLTFFRWLWRRSHPDGLGISGHASFSDGIAYRSDHSQEIPWAGNMMNAFTDVEIHYNRFPRLVTGERLQCLADKWIGTADDFAYNPNRTANSDRQEPCPTQYNRKVIFGYTHHLDWLARATPTFLNPFVLITHNSDAGVENTAAMRTILASPKLVRWYACNLSTHNANPRLTANQRKLRILPIGIANRQWPHGTQFMHFMNLHRGVDFHEQKTKAVYLCLRVETNSGPRTQCLEAVVSKGVEWLPLINPLENVARMAAYRFCVCPPGNGKDTHRLWEALVLRCVPIVVRDAFIEALTYEHPRLPIVVLDAWSDFSQDTLPPYESFDFSVVDTVMDVNHYAACIKADLEGK